MSRLLASVATSKTKSSRRRGITGNHTRIKLAAGVAVVAGLAVFGGWRWAQPALFPAKSSVLAEKVTMPTAINANFLNQVETCFIPVAKAYGYRLDITSDFRSAADQDVLYAQGRTTPGDIVTNARGGRSWHNWGLAVDMADIDDGYDINWERLTKMAAFCGLEHGDRGMEDLPHFQYRGGLSLDDMQQGKWPKPLHIPCQLMIDKKAEGKPLTKTDLRACGAPKF